jgi:SAM-dependent methyltransferase
MLPSRSTCQVCGHDAFVHSDVLWRELIDAWELQPDEVEYINVQQGTRCGRCGVNVRSQALARALLKVLAWPGTLESRANEAAGRPCRILEINEAGALSPWLARLEGHQLMRYPDIDMTRLPFADQSLDIVVHSDTLEHVEDPMRALAECARIIRPDGACIFTVPVRVGRQTRSRRGMPPSYHGHPGCHQADYMVHTEYGSDVWADVLRGGFDSCEIVAYRFPAGIAMIARRS